MFSRQKPPTAKKRNHDLSQFGLMEIPDDFDPTAGYGDDGGDSDLEAELAALATGGGKVKPKPKAKPALVPAADLDKMIADSMKDVGSDDDDEDVDDDDLMGELKNIAGDNDAEDLVEEDASQNTTETFLRTTTINVGGIIQKRIELYKQAEEQAKSAGETAKVRRFARGLKTLQDLLKKAAAGQSVNVDDIPPEVSIKSAKPASEETPTEEQSAAPSTPVRTAPPPPVPMRAAPPTPAVEEVEAAKPQNPLLDSMVTRQREYKAAALQAKRSGEINNALQFLKIVKQFDIVMEMLKNGQEVDMSDMPPPPEEFAAFMAKMQAGESAAPDPPPEAPPAVEEKISTPTSILEALVQRLEKYKSVELAAKEENNASKARRYNRIVKQYEDAIKQQKAGRPVAYDDLPLPPGFGPLPINAEAAKPAPTPASPPTKTPSTETTPVSTPQSEKRTPPKVSPKSDLTTRTSGNLQKNNLAEQQMKILVERQAEFKSAAIEAKKAGEMQQAKEYLKIYKGFDALLNAASSGLPVDLTTLPVAPSQRENLEASFAIVDGNDEDTASDDISDIGVRLEEQLAKQLMMCKNTRDHHKAMCDVAGMNRFENLALTVQKDLDLLRYSKRQNLPLPKFHYEKRSFNIVHCNTDLRDDELEIMIVRGINYAVPNPKEVDTYVKIEFPLLNDEFYRAKSNLVKDTNSPDYNQRFLVEFQRSNRQYQRFFKRHGVKLEVYSRGGFLRSDVLIGTVNVKLQPLETKCDIHDTFDLMEGRRAVGGKLELKIRVRNPILAKQMEHIDEKWLVLDS